jgi:hypothetical protein
MASVKEIENEIESAAETAIKVYEKESYLTTQPHEKENYQPHNGKKFSRIIDPQYDEPYVFTYSEEDNSVLGWLANAEENGQQQLEPDVYFKLDQNYDIDRFVLYKKILVFQYESHRDFCKYLF